MKSLESGLLSWCFRGGGAGTQYLLNLERDELCIMSPDPTPDGKAAYVYGVRPCLLRQKTRSAPRLDKA